MDEWSFVTWCFLKGKNCKSNVVVKVIRVKSTCMYHIEEIKIYFSIYFSNFYTILL